MDASRGYETFYMLPAGSATIEQVRMSSAGIDGYATAQLKAAIESDFNIRLQLYPGDDAYGDSIKADSGEYLVSF